MDGTYMKEMMPRDLQGMLTQYLEVQLTEEHITYDEYLSRNSKFDNELAEILKEQEEAERKRKEELNGPQGIAGDIGPRGCAGVQGVQGPAGVQGSSGSWNRSEIETRKHVTILTLTSSDSVQKITLFYNLIENLNGNAPPTEQNSVAEFMAKVDMGLTVVLKQSLPWGYGSNIAVWMSKTKELHFISFKLKFSGRLALRILEWLREFGKYLPLGTKLS